jgi:hypothetical protein
MMNGLIHAPKTNSIQILENSLLLLHYWSAIFYENKIS